MNCREFHDAAFAWALGAADPAEVERCHAHLKQPAHDGCAEVLARARAAVAAMDEALPALRPDWDAVRRRLSPRSPARLRARRAASLAVAAVVLLAIFGVARERERTLRAERVSAERHARERETLRGRAVAAEAARDRCRAELAALRRAAALPREIVALLERPDTRVERLSPQPGRGERATLLLNPAARRAFVISTSAPPRAGSDLQLWVIRGKAAPAPAGFLRAAEGDVLLGEVDPALLAAGTPDAVAVSLEPAGGRPTPTEVVLVGVLGG